MTTTISRLFDDYTSAENAVSDLQAAGVPAQDISIMANNAQGWYDPDRARHDKDRDGVDDRAEGAGTGAGIGAFVGGAAGLLAGLGVIAIPGIGPVVAAGWLAATAAGVVAGGAAGGIIGALTEAGVSREQADVYAEGIRRGGALVTARVAEADQARLKTILDRTGVDMAEREKLYRASGWNRFDPSADPYAADQVRAEREPVIPPRP
jgi:hypothetical protein